MQIRLGEHKSRNKPFWLGFRKSVGYRILILDNEKFMGINWVEDGYMRIKIVDGNGICGIHTDCEYCITK